MTSDNGLAVVVVSPVQLTKCHPVAGVAVSVTGVPWSYVAWLGLFDTLPLPAVVTASVYVLIPKFAVSVRLRVMTSGKGLVVAVVSPVQLTKCQPVVGVAVSVTAVPWLYVAWFGLFDTLPWPVVVTASV